ncbi:L-lactate dehydrogenase [Spiroplasma endosymbiont of Eupeodes luniger]|uniref:L-lactate dehydrogenase n=1 Tax=Spiroplasma endosymbiont of Eupeodes luniger TaxID=3066300 RepID=UPI003BB0B041
MLNNRRKIVLVGCGAVGSSFLYSCINTGLASEYVLIDAFQDVAHGNRLDFEDTLAWQERPFHKITNGSYLDCKDADIIVITAGRPQKPDEIRLDLVVDNAKIISNIMKEIKNSGFGGIVIIASNPVDVLTFIAQKVSGFATNRIFGSGTILDSSRLMFALGEHFKISPTSVTAYIAGEHGDSSVALYSKAIVGAENLMTLKKNQLINDETLKSIHKLVIQKAYEIIKLKKATHYGIGVCLAKIVKAVLNDEQVILPVGAYLNGEYHQKDIYTGIPAVIGSNGIERVVQLDISEQEQDQFNSSCDALRKVITVAIEAIN